MLAISTAITVFTFEMRPSVFDFQSIRARAVLKKAAFKHHLCCLTPLLLLALPHDAPLGIARAKNGQSRAEY